MGAQGHRTPWGKLLRPKTGYHDSWLRFSLIHSSFDKHLNKPVFWRTRHRKRKGTSVVRNPFFAMIARNMRSWHQKGAWPLYMLREMLTWFHALLDAAQIRSAQVQRLRLQCAWDWTIGCSRWELASRFHSPEFPLLLIIMKFYKKGILII